MSTNQEAVGQDRDAKALMSLLDAADQMPDVVRMRARSYELLDLMPGSAVLDVGCGPGRAVAELAERGVEAVGVDPNRWMLEAARDRWPAREFREGTAEELPFPDGCVRGWRAEKVLHVLDEPERAIAEARRVLVPGGRIVVLGQDWDAIMIDADDAALTAAILRAGTGHLGSPRVARRYRNLLLDGGFEDVTVEPHAQVFTDATMLPVVARLAEAAAKTGAVDRAGVEEWLAGQRRRAESDRCMLAIPFFMAAGTAPA